MFPPNALAMKNFLLLSRQQEEVALFVECAVTLIRDLRKCTSTTDVAFALGSCYRALTGQSVIGKSLEAFTLLSAFAEEYLCTLQGPSEWIKTLDAFHSNLHRVRGSVLGNKIIKVFNHLFAQIIYHKIGLQFNQEMFDKLEQNRIRPTVWNVLSFADAVSGLFLFLIKQGRHAMLTGDINCLFVDGGVTTEFLNTLARLRKDFEFLGNPEAVGIKLPLFLKEVEDAISTGEAIRKVVEDSLQKRLVETALLELRTLQKKYVSTSRASAQRWAPVSVVLYGDAGIGKSFLLQGMFAYYCSLRGLKPDQSVLYSRNFDDKYWSGYKSWMAGIQFDDVAKHLPGKLPGPDPSIAEVISVVNNVAMVTNQAEAPDKGKIPINSEWVGITTNVADMNIRYNYGNTHAVLRRLPLRITPVVKEEFVVPGTTRLDSTKVPEGNWPDCWNFKVANVVQVDQQHAVYEDVLEFSSYRTLLDHLRTHYQKHIDSQVRYMDSINKMGIVELCRCQFPREHCICDDMSLYDTHDGRLQSGNDSNVLTPLQFENIIRQHCLGMSPMESQFFKEKCEEFFPDRISSEEFEEFTDNHSSDMERFRSLSNYEQAMELKFIPRHENSRNWLNFIPDIGPIRNFEFSSIKPTFDFLSSFADRAWGEKEQLCIQDFVQQEVPDLVKEGWTDKSLIKGMYSYVSECSDRIDLTLRNRVVEVFDFTVERSWKYELTKNAIIWYFERKWFRITVNALIIGPIGKRILKHCFANNQLVSQTLLVQATQEHDRRLKGEHPFVLLMRAILGTAMLMGFFALVKSYVFPKKSNNEACFVEAQVQMVPALREIGKPPIHRKDEKENPWNIPERDITSADFSPKRATNLGMLEGKLVRNLVCVTITGETPLGHYTTPTKAVILDNNTILINNHSIEDECTVVVHLGSVSRDGLHPDVEIKVVPSMIKRSAERDLAWITTLGLPRVFKDIRPNMVKSDFKGRFDGYYLFKERDGSLRKKEVCGVHYGKSSIPSHNIAMEAIAVKVEEPTVSGDCGGVLIMETGWGPMIVGIHYAWEPNAQVALVSPVFVEDVPLQGIMVQCGSLEIDVVDNSKLYTDYHSDGKLMVHGGYPGFRPRMKATGTHTEIASHVFRRASHFGISAEDKMHRPIMSGWEPQQNALKEYIKPTHSIDEKVFGECVETFLDHVKRNMTEHDRADIHPMNIDYAVCGAPGIPNVDGQKTSTSGGFGFPGAKKAYMDALKEHGCWNDYKRYKDEVEDIIHEKWLQYKQGIRCHPIASAQLKNEMVSYKKLVNKKTRVFFMCSLWFLTLLRTMTLGMSRVMVRRRDIFCTAVGLNTHSEQWQGLHERLNRLPGDNWIAGDFVGFDKILSLLISNGVSKFFLDLAQWSDNYTPDELIAFETMLADVSHPTIDFFGTVITLMGGEISGHQLTTFFNSVANVLLHMYAFKQIYPQEDFFEEVTIVTLGDDVVQKVSPSCQNYHHTSVQEAFASIGIQYTMAEKDAESVPYISQSEVTFLKRCFASHEEFDYVVAPLEKDSIVKMLCYTIPSKEISASEQLAQSINAAVTESFYHGRDYYDSIVSLIEDCEKSFALQTAVQQHPYPTWEELKNRFIDNSPSMGLVSGPSQKTPSQISYCTYDNASLQSKMRMGSVSLPTSERPSKVPFQGRARLDSEKANKEVRYELGRYPDNTMFTKNFLKTECTCISVPQNLERYLVNKNKHIVNKFLALQAKKERQRYRVDVWGSTELQSEKVYSTPETSGSTDQVQQQLTFANEPTGVMVDISGAKNKLAEEARIPQVLGEYLSRPLKIFDYQWAEGGADGLKTTFTPWSLYLAEINVAKKLSGFSLLRANLKLKFLINGSPFYYGAMYAAYTPLTTRTDTAAFSSVPLLLVANSQKPGVWLNPQSLSTAEMKLPFLWPYPYIDIQLVTRLATLGKVELLQYAPLLSANGTNAQNLDIAVYAWLEDIELSGPSDQAVLQSQKEYQQDHQISELASTVGSVAGALSNAPVIGPYMKATEMAANMASGVASALGFTNVPNVGDVIGVKPMPFQLASSSISEPVMKLSLQPKQEVNLGVANLGDSQHDELHIKNFVTRESYMTATDWPISGAGSTIGSTLFTWGVSPLSYDITGNAVAHSPMSYMSQNFQYWRGDIIVKVKVIKSQYHRGRLALSWDRAANNLSEGAVLGNPNTHTVIADLDETDEVEMRIPYQQERQFLETYTALTIPSNRTWTTSVTPTGAWSGMNGIFNVRVMNRLSAPEASSTVRLMIFVRAAENMQFAGPAEWSTTTTANITGITRNTTSVLQSEKVYDNDMGTSDCDEVYGEVFGEKISSIRELLHRSSLSISVPFVNTAVNALAMSIIDIPVKRFPPFPGCYNNGWSVATVNAVAGQRVFFSKFHPLCVFGSCFIGYRGSTNVTVNIEGTDRNYNLVSVTRVQSAYALSSANRLPRVTGIVGSDSTNLKSQSLSIATSSGATGKALINTRTNTGLVANLPYYSNSGFYLMDSDGMYNNQDTVTDQNNDWWEIEARCETTAVGALNNTVVSLYYGSGPDLNFVFFINVPILVRTPVTV